MPLYISLQKYTDQGIKDVKGTPERLEKAMKGAEAMGCKILGYYAVMGEYDAVAIGEFPNDEAVMSFSLMIGSAGNIRTTTLKAFSKDEFVSIIKKLP
jgi:uncharacterized protein with GYD domain